MNNPKVTTAQSLLTEALTEGGLPIAVSRPEKDGTLTIVVNAEGVVQKVDDYGRVYEGKKLSELPVSELGVLVDFGSRDPEVVEDLGFTDSPTI